MSDTTIHIRDITLTKGTVIQGRYEITRHLGAGGFAQVFEAFDSNIERPVAIKFLNLHAATNDADASDRIVSRFKREAKTAARIQHPNVVNIFDFGVIGAHDDIPFIVMELLAGHDLEEQIYDHGAMSPERAIPLFVDSLEALAVAHKMGIVHKDLKPSNLFLSNPGERTESLRIVDFGIAHIRDAREGRLTATGEMLGTPQYLSPEYIESQVVTPSFDVYQMGLIMIEALIGRPVVDEDHPLRCVQVHATGELKVPTSLLDTDLGPVLAKALHLDHEQRYRDAERFADALAAVPAASIPPMESDAPMSKLRGTGSMDSNSRLTGAVTGEMNQPTTGQLTVGDGQRSADQSKYPTTDNSPKPTEQRNHKTGFGASSRATKTVVALLLAVVALGGIAVWLFTQKTDNDATTHANAKLAPNASAEPAAGSPGAAGPAADAVEPAAAAPGEDEPDNLLPRDKNGVTDAQPASVTVTTIPASAVVYRGDHKLGTSPVSVAFDADIPTPVELRVTHAGYETKKTSLSPHDGDKQVIALRKKPLPKAERPSPKPVARPEPAAPKPPKSRSPSRPDRPAQKPHRSSNKTDPPDTHTDGDDDEPARRMLIAP